MGFAFSIYPGITMMSAAAAMQRALAYVRDNGSALGIDMPLATLADLNEITGFAEVWQFERTYASLIDELEARKLEPVR
jgi:hypothetical protein